MPEITLSYITGRLNLRRIRLVKFPDELLADDTKAIKNANGLLEQNPLDIRRNFDRKRAQRVLREIKESTDGHELYLLCVIEFRNHILGSTKFTEFRNSIIRWWSKVEHPKSLLKWAEQWAGKPKDPEKNFMKTVLGGEEERDSIVAFKPDQFSPTPTEALSLANVPPLPNDIDYNMDSEVELRHVLEFFEMRNGGHQKVKLNVCRSMLPSITLMDGDSKLYMEHHTCHRFLNYLIAQKGI